MPVPVLVKSCADARSTPLFPVFCGDNGAVASIASDAYIDCGPRGFKLYDPPAQLLRLGPKSRALVMSLYRAIVERFYIMRSTGCAANRPAKPSFCFGGILTACNGNSCKMDLAGRNRRRAFGGFFRDTFHKLRDYAYPCRATVAVQCGELRFYPFTPNVRNVGGCFMPGAVESGTVSGRPFNWDAACASWSRFSTGCELHPWLWDVGDRSLGRAFAASYCAAGYPDASCFVRFAAALSGVPIQRLRSWDTCGPVGCGLPHAGCVGDLMTNYFAGNLPPTFNLPALAAALRIFSAWNAQTMSLAGGPSIPHNYTYAARRVVFRSSGDTIRIEPDANQFIQCTIYCDKVTIKGRKSYEAGEATLGAGYVWYRLADRIPCAGDTPLGYSRIYPACWQQWQSRTTRDAGSASEAIAVYETIKPAAGRATFGAVYPARWARNEGDIGFAAASTFAFDDCGNRAWVARKNSYGDGDFNCLANAIINASILRLCTDTITGGFNGGDTFSGVAFPTTAAAVCNELVAPDTPDLAALYAEVAAANQIANQSEPRYCFIAVYKCGSSPSDIYYYGVNGSYEANIEVCYFGTGYKWMKLGAVPGASVGFGYDRITCTGGHVRIDRHPFSVDRNIRFGGFFGTVIFNNKAAQQVP